MTPDGKKGRIRHQKRTCGYLKEITRGRRKEQDTIMLFLFFFLMTFTNIISSIRGKLDTMISILLLRKRKRREGRV